MWRRYMAATAVILSSNRLFTRGRVHMRVQMFTRHFDVVAAIANMKETSRVLPPRERTRSLGQHSTPVETSGELRLDLLASSAAPQVPQESATRRTDPR